MPESREIYRRTLAYAITIAGSEGQVAILLNVTAPQLRNWQDGIEEIPLKVFLEAVDIITMATPEQIAHSRELLSKRNP